MLLIVGLGNPGSEYDGTRHNIGFDILDASASRLGVRFRPGRGEYHEARGQIGDTPFLLVKPQTYMNNSGTAVREILEREGAAPEDVLVVSDDFHLRLGRLRLRLTGSSGGHNGLASVLQELASDRFPRLRCGIAGDTMPADKSELRDYVLRPFDRKESEAAVEMIGHAHRFLRLIITEGPAKAQQQFQHTR